MPEMVASVLLRFMERDYSLRDSAHSERLQVRLQGNYVMSNKKLMNDKVIGETEKWFVLAVTDSHSKNEWATI